ncbi:hypothetical protein IPZ78_01050 [Sphingobacterium sp. WQ 366]|uniref:Uncharacterized protein n=2 Tax=Sphingobacterium bovistauri TaxID=2781959 RepID=A0ABS7Z2D1_9SPHI|nr:hypothetical protein [Sphingobacterium bovistauri]
MILNKRRKIILSIIGLILLLPIIGMQFSNEVNWSGFDFIIAGLLLSTIGLAVELLFQFTKNNTQRFLFLGIILILGFLVWAEMAVGIFGSPFAGS